jgi:RNA polymerase sigma factor (sigma-70 family)
MPASPSYEVPDAKLIARCIVADDRHAFAELVKRHQSSVRACLRKLTAGNHALADDLAQDTFVLAWRNLKSFRQEARFSTWLYRIATNCWLAQARKRREELLGERDVDVSDDEADDSAVGGGEGGDHAAAATMRIDLERAMARLSEAERAAIVQCYHNDLSHEEAAYVLGWPVGTVKTHILRGKQKLKAALGAWAPPASTRTP